MASLIGIFRIGRDAELRSTADGTPVAGVALAFNYGRKDGTGKQPTQWVEASIWGDRASKIYEHLTKGKQIYASIDDPHVETYNKNDGTQGIKFAGRIGTLEFVAGSPAAPRPIATPPSPKPAPKPPTSTGSGFDDMDDDIPF